MSSQWDSQPSTRLADFVEWLLEHDRLRYYLQLLFPVGLIVLFIGIPLALIVVWSFTTAEGFDIQFQFSLKNYAEFVGSYRWDIFLRTLRDALIQVVLIVLVGFPIAYYAGVKKRHSKYTIPLLLLFAVPFLTSYILRTLAWVAILGNNGLINTILIITGVTKEPVSWLLYSSFSVNISLLASYLPFVVFPTWLAMFRIDEDVLRASEDLGATPFQTMRHVVIPLSLPGVLIGAVFVFVGVLGDTTTSSVLGGPSISYIATVINTEATSFGLPLASAISVSIGVLALFLIGIWELVYGLDKIGEI